MEQHAHFDYIIIGCGLAGFQLALKMSRDAFFSEKRIALIDPSEKNNNDKTWSFWETEPSNWNGIVSKSWKKAKVITSTENLSFSLKPYDYKSVRAIDFYRSAKQQLGEYPNFKFITETVKSISEDNKTVTAHTNMKSYSAAHIFDSRIPEAFFDGSEKHISLIQHFKGWVIKTEKKCFDDSVFTMMDYRLKDGEQTTFTYVLPFSETEALIEFTYFTEKTVDESTYDFFIKQYINDYLKIDDYSITETETGQIPMTTFPFHKFNTCLVTKIGTGGGWVKPSTGYSFKHTEKKVARIIENLKLSRMPSSGLFKKRFRFYDKVFLKVLKDENHKGEWLFGQFYKKNHPKTIFRFLDEESTFWEELKIMKSLFSWQFIKAFFKTL